MHHGICQLGKLVENIVSDIDRTKDNHMSSCGLPIVKILEKIDLVIMALHCILAKTASGLVVVDVLPAMAFL